MPEDLDQVLQNIADRARKATLPEESREELQFVVESFAQRFHGQTMEGKPLQDASDTIMDIFSLAYRLAMNDMNANQ